MNNKMVKSMNTLSKLFERGDENKIILNGLGHDGRYSRNEIDRKEWNRP